MIRAEPEAEGVEVLGTVAGVGKTLVPVTRREVTEWINCIVAALISTRVPGLNCRLE
jgi:hypothetical protein